MTENPEIRLNPDHDVKAYREAFARDKMLHIPNILVPEAAKRLHRCLTEEISWNLTYNDDEGLQHLFASKMAKMTPAERVALQQKVLQRAKTGKFQFFFGSFARFGHVWWLKRRIKASKPIKTCLTVSHETCSRY